MKYIPPSLAKRQERTFRNNQKKQQYKRIDTTRPCGRNNKLNRQQQ